MTQPLSAFVLGALLLALPVHRAAAAAPMRFKSASIDLPQGDRVFPGGQEAEAINNNCLGCHSVGMVLTQPKLTRAEWQGEVTKMIAAYKAPIDQSDVRAIVDYLAALNPQP